MTRRREEPDRPDPRGLVPEPTPADLRLLLPALLGWTVVAALLGSSPGCLLTISAAAVALPALALGFLWVRRRRRTRHSFSSRPDSFSSRTGDSRVDAAHRSPQTRRQGRLRWRRARAGLAAAGQPAGRRGWASLAAASALAVGLMLAASAAAIAIRDAGPVGELATERAVVTMTGTVATDPRALDPPAGRPESAAGVLLRLDVADVVGRGARTQVQSPVLVFADRSWLSVRWQQRVTATGRLAPAEDPADDVVAVFTPTGAPVAVDDPGLVARVAEVVRSRFAESTDGLPADARGLLPGLVIGDTSRTPHDLDDAMLVTGMTHLSAVSGSNVAIVLTAALGLGALCGLRRQWRPWLAAALLAAFVVLVRPEPSVVRAAAMGAVGLVGLASSRRRAGIPALATAVIVLLCWDPWLSRSAGFALSTLATLGLLLFANPWGAVIGRWLPRPIRGWGPALAVPVAAQLMCAPVIVLLQGAVSVVGVAANLLAAPFVAPATVLGVATALCSVVSTTLASWVAWLAALPTLAIAWVARAGAQAPFASIPWPRSGLGAVVLALISVFLVLAGPWLLRHGARRPLVPAAVVLLSAGSLAPTQSVTWPMAAWAFVACDVGQGDGLVLSTGPGRAVVVDTGPDPALIDGCLGRLHITVVDAVVLTHFHADHVDGLPGVLRGRSVRQVLASPVRDPEYQWQEVSTWASAAGVPVADLFAGDAIVWPGVTAHVWWPARVIRAGSVPNNASVVLTVETAGLRLLLLGDVEREAAHEVLLELQRDARAPPSFDVVKVAHHGSANRDDGLLALVRAPVAVISVGAGNDYGHPAASTLSALAADGYRVYRTDLSGDIALRRGSAVDGSTVEVATSR